MIPRNPIDFHRAYQERKRFESKYEQRGFDECWPWQAGTFGDDYGRFTLDGRRHQAHRIAWALSAGCDPGMYLVLHRCDNPPCVNPAHLYTGDQADNMRDARTRGGHQNPSVFGSPGESNPNAKLTVSEVHEIRARAETGQVTQAALADDYGVAPSLISMVVNREMWDHV